MFPAESYQYSVDSATVDSALWVLNSLIKPVSFVTQIEAVKNETWKYKELLEWELGKKNNGQHYYFSSL